MFTLRVKTFLSGFCCVAFLVANIIACVALSPTMRGLSEHSYDGGWKPSVEVNETLQAFPDEWQGQGQGQTRLLFMDYKYVHGEIYVPRNQGRSPSCVGQAVAAAVDILAAIEVKRDGRERAPPASASAEVIYGLSRQEIGGIGPNAGGGSHNRWAVRALQEYGAVANLRYPFIGVDLRQPSAEMANKLGRTGISDSLEFVAKLHPVRDYIKINSYSELRDAIYAGCPVVIGSNQGFGSGKLTRDSEGFLNPPRRLFRPSVWKHSMACIAICDTGRKGAMILNSWGTEWISGPNRFEFSPEGTFFVDSGIIDRMVKQGDAFAIRDFRGYANFRIWGTKY